MSGENPARLTPSLRIFDIDEAYALARSSVDTRLLASDAVDEWALVDRP